MSMHSKDAANWSGIEPIFEEVLMGRDAIDLPLLAVPFGLPGIFSLRVRSTGRHSAPDSLHRRQELGLYPEHFNCTPDSLVPSSRDHHLSATAELTDDMVRSICYRRGA
ncbi:hypothetical protein F9C07_5246 [Aspergillus flavus]|uniref:Uncharacterized protein n=1 Tax=Aspergillus flavus (strain ATCC 200026 / FGSC A1120 / IAM 13836 / NRRL 3357 / JCM 12722 / SRRC 167) TaxID=332952 RepID=A0A7U2MWI6_ASPFN|nr:hypothetical protein F9C07_5246 [Aspergillus flavus]